MPQFATVWSSDNLSWRFKDKNRLRSRIAVPDSEDFNLSTILITVSLGSTSIFSVEPSGNLTLILILAVWAAAGPNSGPAAGAHFLFPPQNKLFCFEIYYIIEHKGVRNE